MSKIKIQTERDLLGDEFLKNGEVIIEPVEGYSNLVHIHGDDCNLYINRTELEEALGLLTAKNSELMNKEATLYITNLNCHDPRFPSFDQIKFDGRSYPVINLDAKEINKIIKEQYPNGSHDNYFELKVLFNGDILERDGFMPNPTVRQQLLSLHDVKFIGVSKDD
jgi:hypothetical protein